jgi:hypothetical protein
MKQKCAQPAPPRDTGKIQMHSVFNPMWRLSFDVKTADLLLLSSTLTNAKSGCPRFPKYPLRYRSPSSQAYSVANVAMGALAGVLLLHCRRPALFDWHSAVPETPESHICRSGISIFGAIYRQKCFSPSSHDPTAVGLPTRAMVGVRKAAEHHSKL